MLINYLKYVLLFLLLALLQVYVLNNILFLNFINPYLYIYVIFILPIRINRTFILLLGFIYGLFIDILSASYAVHAISTTLISFLRPFILKIYSPFDGYEATTIPSIKECGLTWWIKYSITLVIIHHLCLFTIEEFNFSNIFNILVKTALTSIFTFFTFFLFELIRNRKVR